MNNWHDEYTAECNRRRILEEVEQIRLERLALQSRAYRPRFFARTMFNFANWMIATGKRLRKRYMLSNPMDEVPAAHPGNSPTGSLAH